jgi:hypothetical protein
MQSLSPDVHTEAEELQDEHIDCVVWYVSGIT